LSDEPKNQVRKAFKNRPCLSDGGASLENFSQRTSIFLGAVSKVETVSFFIGYCDKNRKKIFAGMFVFCIFIAVNQ
jgi:hypothetical protein